jgi:hypothetical protein
MAARTAWRICRDNGWWSAFGKPKRGKGQKPGPPVHDDPVQREFTPARRNERLLADITEHGTAEGKLYLLRRCDVLGVDMRDANLTGAQLNGAIYRTQMQGNSTRGDSHTILPDGHLDFDALQHRLTSSKANLPHKVAQRPASLQRSTSSPSRGGHAPPPAHDPPQLLEELATDWQAPLHFSPATTDLEQAKEWLRDLPATGEAPERMSRDRILGRRASRGRRTVRHDLQSGSHGARRLRCGHRPSTSWSSGSRCSSSISSRSVA